MSNWKKKFGLLLERDKIVIEHNGIGMWFLAIMIFLAVAEYNAHWEMIETCRLLQECAELSEHVGD